MVAEAFAAVPENVPAEAFAAVPENVPVGNANAMEDAVEALALRLATLTLEDAVEALDPVIPSVKRGRDGALLVAQPCHRRHRNEAADGINALPRCSVCAAYLTPQVRKHEWHDQSSNNWETWHICCHPCFLAWLDAGCDS